MAEAHEEILLEEIDEIVPASIPRKKDIPSTKGTLSLQGTIFLNKQEAQENDNLSLFNSCSI